MLAENAAFDSILPGGKTVDNLAGYAQPPEMPTKAHRIIHTKPVHEKQAANKQETGAFHTHVTPVGHTVIPHYPQPPLPLPFLINNRLIEVGAVQAGDESSGAVFSTCRAYRYILTRYIQPAINAPCVPVCFLMLNPSTADESKLDPTIRRCVRFAERWGGDRLIVVNMFAFRATDPKAMKRQADPIGALNKAWVQHAVQTTLAQNGIVIAAWGGNGDHRKHDDTVREWLREIGAAVHCLGYTERGYQPRHPLFVPRHAEPEIYKTNR